MNIQRFDPNQPTRQDQLANTSRQTQPAGERPCCITQWTPFDGSGSLLGKATIQFRNGLIIVGIPVFRRNDGSLSVGTPDTPLVDADGQQLRNAEGKRRYARVATPEARERWSRAVLTALADAGIGGASP